MPKSSWSEERVELLKKLWDEGKTAAQIAETLGGVTRNAVIGKAHRLKLSGRVSPIKTSKKVKSSAPSQATSKQTGQPAQRSKPAPEFVDKAPEGDGISLLELRERNCRWPLGDPQHADFKFCGCSSLPGIPYCPEHASIAYQASKRNFSLPKNVDFDTPKKQDDIQDVVSI